MQFSNVVTALAAGKSVRRSGWESITRAYVVEPITSMFVLNDVLVCQRGDGAPYTYDLSWYEIAARDWEIIEVATVANAA
jgi:hypothetical protein